MSDAAAAPAAPAAEHVEHKKDEEPKQAEAKKDEKVPFRKMTLLLVSVSVFFPECIFS
jgi:hypothetical protein